MNLAKYIQKLLPKYIYIEKYDTITKSLYILVSHKNIFFISRILRDHSLFQYKSIMDVCVVDWIGLNNLKSKTGVFSKYINKELNLKDMRFEVIYNYLSTTFNSRLFLKIYVDETTPVSSLTSLYEGVNWAEREAWDMFGIWFINHPDLRRILTDYGFEGFPMRKDFPLSGFIELRYSESKKRIVTEPVQLSQEFRTFDFETPWDTSNLS